jgi:hypothetical protein
MFLIALSAFVLTSSLTGAAQTPEWLLAARLLQGVAGGMLIPQNVGLIQDMSRGAERARAFGVLGSVVGLSTAIGPVVGGLILDLAGTQDGWRCIFYVNVPIGLPGAVLPGRPGVFAAALRARRAPFALGSAVSAVFAGHAVPRSGRWLNVSGLLAAAIGMGATALVLRTVSGDAAAWAAAGPLLVAGLGGGMAVSPNTTQTLESVHARMAGAAGGALQTAQRIGAAIGTAVLATVYYHALTGSGRDFAAAVSDVLLCAAGLTLLALVMAVAELIERRHRSVPSGASGETGATADPASPQTTPHVAVMP